MELIQDLTVIQRITVFLFFAAMLFAFFSGIWIRKKVTIGVLETALLPIIVAAVVLWLPIQFFNVPIWLSVIGLLLFIKGVVIQELAVLRLGNQVDDFWFSRNSKKERFVVRQGLYRYIRHPIYTGMMLMYFGLLILFFNYFILAGVLIAFSIIIITAVGEEKFLSQRFPEYTEYKQNTGMFFPRLWS